MEHSRPKKDDRIVRRPRGHYSSHRPAHRRNRSTQQQHVTPTPHSSPSPHGRHASYSSGSSTGSGGSAPPTNNPRHKGLFSVARLARRFKKAAQISNQRKSRSLPTALKLNRRFEPEFREPPPLLNDDEDEEEDTALDLLMDFENEHAPIQPVIDPEREAAAHAEAEEERRLNDQIEKRKWRQLNRMLQAMKMEEDDWANASTSSMGAIEQKRKRHTRDDRSSDEDKRERTLQGKKKKKKSFDIREQPSEEEEQEVSADGSEEEENEELASFLTSGDDELGDLVESDAVFQSPLRCPAPDPIEMLQGGLLVRASPRTLTPTPTPATITAIASFHTSSPSGSSIILTPLASPSRALTLINQSSSSSTSTSSGPSSSSTSSSTSSSRLASRSGSMYTSTSSSEEESSSSCPSSPQSSNESDPNPPPRRRRRHHTHTSSSARHSPASRAEQFRPTMPPLDFSLLKPLMGPATIAAGNSSSGRESGVSSGSGRRTLSARLQTPRATKATPRADILTPKSPPDTPPPDPSKRATLGDSSSAFTKCVLRSNLSSQSV